MPWPAFCDPPGGYCPSTYGGHDNSVARESCGGARSARGLWQASRSSAVLRLLRAQHRREALHHGGVELLGGDAAQIVDREPIVRRHVVPAAHGEGARDARDRAAAPALRISAAVPAFVAVDEGVHGAVTDLVGFGVAVLAAPEDALHLVLYG